jgi:hypothetical protein
MQADEQTLVLDALKRARTLVRIDAGCYAREDVNCLLLWGYQVHYKDHSSSRAEGLAQTVP